MNFGEAINLLKQGKMIQRRSWNNDEVFVFMQVHATIDIDIVPKMQSLPQAVKDEFQRRFKEFEMNSICYDNQLAIVSELNEISGYSPSASDVLAVDWIEYK